MFTASDGGHTEDLNVQWGTPLVGLSRTWRASAIPATTRPPTPGPIGPASSPRGALTTALVAVHGRHRRGVRVRQRSTRGVSGRIEDAVVHGADGDGAVTGSELRSALSAARRSRVDQRGQERGRRDPLEVRLADVRARPAHIHRRSRSPAEPGRRSRRGRSIATARSTSTVWLKGPLYEEYLAVGGAPGRLGLPDRGSAQHREAPRHRLPRRLLARRLRARTDLLEGRPRCVRPVGGRARRSISITTERPDSLGFPTSRVQTQDNGSHSATFEHGTITCASGGTCRTS